MRGTIWMTLTTLRSHSLGLWMTLLETRLQGRIPRRVLRTLLCSFGRLMVLMRFQGCLPGHHSLPSFFSPVWSQYRLHC